MKEIKEEGLSLAEENEDEPSADLLIGLQGKLEKEIWMLKSYQGYE